MFLLASASRCGSCGVLYAVAAGDARPIACCGRETTTVPLTAIAEGTLIYWPNPDQFADAPAIVEASPRGVC